MPSLDPLVERIMVSFMGCYGAIMFVLQAVLDAATRGERGCAMSLFPGLSAETMLFHGAHA